MKIQDEVLAEIFRDGLTARAVPKDADGNYVRGGLMSMRSKTMRLMKLTLENFRAFRGETTFDFNGRNVLIYGENGSGKTSVWSALDLFLQAAIIQPHVLSHKSLIAEAEAKSRAAFAKHRYQFNKAPGRVQFEVLDELGLMEDVPRTDIYSWSLDESPFQNPEIMSSARVSARLDYRGLWETYFAHRKRVTINWWPLLLETLIPDIDMPNGLTISQGWNNLNRYGVWMSLYDVDEDSEWDEDEMSDYDESDERELSDEEFRRAENFEARFRATGVELFGTNLVFTLENIQKEAQAILNVLSPGLSFRWRITSPVLKSSRRDEAAGRTDYNLYPPKVKMDVALADNTLKNHHNLLNEARLSALALSIYLAAAKMNAAQARSGFKILALDDVLIGLDMSNRLPVLDVLEHWFRGWQVFIFTYDRAWYELAKSRLNKDKWKHFEFYAGGELPVWGEDCAALEKSKKYLTAANELRVPDYKAAGVWARSAFEWMMKWFCDKYAIPVPYCLDEKFLKAETLWQKLKQLEVEILEKQGAPLTQRKLISGEIGDGVSRCKSQHLNPLCHANLNSFNSEEIQTSIQALEALQTELSRDFHSVSLPKASAPIIEEKKITDYDIENLPKNVQEAIYRRAGKSLGHLPGKTKKEGNDAT